ncbi:MAG: hypothetical protein ACI8QS_002464 [Planctomycetota bacterium]|jgi:hypothetical protein
MDGASRRCCRPLGSDRSARSVLAHVHPGKTAYIKRVIGTLRAEFTHDLISIGRRHLPPVFSEYLEYYNKSRPNQSLERDAPQHQSVERVDDLNAWSVPNRLHRWHFQAS